MEIDGNTMYLSGGFTSLNDDYRPYLGAISKTTGATLPWNPITVGSTNSIKVTATSVILGGSLTMINNEVAVGFGFVPK